MALEILRSADIRRGKQVTGKKVWMSRDGNIEGWWQFGSNNPAFEKYGLKEVIREYDGPIQSKQALRKQIMIFSANPLLEEICVSGTFEEVSQIWKAVKGVAENREETLRLLKILSKTLR